MNFGRDRTPEFFGAVFSFFTRVIESRVARAVALNNIQFTKTKINRVVSLTNSRGSRVAGPQSRSRVQSRGRGSNSRVVRP